MREFLELARIVIYLLIAIAAVSVVKIAIEQRRVLPILLFKGKSYRKFKGKGLEVINTQIYLTVEMVGKKPDFVVAFKDRKVALSGVITYGKGELGEALVKVLFNNNEMVAICFSEKILAESMHRNFMKTFREVFFIYVGVYVIWSILLKT